MGSDDALWAVWRRHQAQVRGYLRKHLARLTEDDAAVLEARVFELFRACSARIPPGCDAGRWIFGVARNVVREHRRKTGRRRRLDGDTVSAEAPTPVPSVEALALARSVERTLQDYPDPRAARAWWSRVILEEELADLAGEHAVSLATVKRWITAVRVWLGVRLQVEAE